MADAEAIAVLFTDLVGSTARQSEVGDARFDEIRRAHFGQLRAVVESGHGTEVKNLGDGLMVVFRSASNAIGAAVEMMVECNRLARSDPGLGVGVKIGVSIGDAVMEDGDWFGTPVVEAARLCAACRPGQILVTEMIRLMAGTRTRERIEPVGSLDLKGLPDPLMAYEVAWESAEAASGVPLPTFFVTSGGVPFAGRVNERATLDVVWKAAQDGPRRVVLVAGEPGIGKTRLISEFAASAHADGAVVLAGRSDDALDVPFGPFAEVLDCLVRHAADDLIAAHLTQVGPVVTRIVPLLASRAGLETTRPMGESDADRLELFHGVTDLLRRQAERLPTVVVLDDLHWADGSSLQLLRHLVRHLGNARILILGTYRDTDLDRTHPLSGMLADFRRESGVDRISLDGLNETDVLEYMTLISGQELDAEAVDLGRQIAGTTAGNPFFVSETLRHLAESGAIVQRDGRWTRGTLDAENVGVPEGVREVVGRRLSALHQDIERLLSVAAVAGASFDVTIVAAVAEVSESAAVDYLDEATTRSLVVEDATRFGWYRFAHALVRQTLLEELSTTRRVRLHRAIAEQIEARTPSRIEEIAYHFLESAAAGVGDKAVDYASRAAAAALDRGASEQAILWLRRAIEAEDGLDPDPARRASLLIDLGEASFYLDQCIPVAGELIAAADLARTAGCPDLLAQAAYWYLGPFAAASDLSDTVGRALLEEARSALSTCADDKYIRERMLVAGKLSNYHMFDADPSVRQALGQEANEYGGRLDDPMGRWMAVAWRIASLAGTDQYQELGQLIEESSAMAAFLPAVVKRDALQWELGMARTRGDTSAVTAVIDTYRSILEPLGMAFPGMLYGAPGVSAIDAGRLSDGLALLEWYRAEATEGFAMSQLAAGAAAVWPLLWMAEPEPFAELVNRFAQSAAAVLAVYPLAALQALLQGDEASARTRYAEWRAMLSFVPASFSFHVYATATYPTWRLGDREVAGLANSALRGHAGRWLAIDAVLSCGPADLHIGVNHLTLDDAPAAVGGLRAALDLCVRAGATAWETVTLLHLAEALHRVGERDEAAAHAAQASTQAQQLGMNLIVQDLQTLGFVSN